MPDRASINTGQGAMACRMLWQQNLTYLSETHC